MELQKTESAKKPGNGLQAPDLFDNAVQIESGEERVYFHMESGNILRGYLLSESTIPAREEGEFRRIYGIEIDVPCKVVSAETSTPFEADRGDVVFVSERHVFKRLADFVNGEYYTAVKIVPTEKVKISNGQTVWRANVFVAPTKRKNPFWKQPTRDLVVADSDVPF